LFVAAAYYTNIIRYDDVPDPVKRDRRSRQPPRAKPAFSPARPCPAQRGASEAHAQRVGLGFFSVCVRGGLGNSRKFTTPRGETQLEKTEWPRGGSQLSESRIKTALRVRADKIETAAPIEISHPPPPPRHCLTSPPPIPSKSAPVRLQVQVNRVLRAHAPRGGHDRGLPAPAISARPRRSPLARSSFQGRARRSLRVATEHARTGGRQQPPPEGRTDSVVAIRGF